VRSYFRRRKTAFSACTVSSPWEDLSCSYAVRTVVRLLTRRASQRLIGFEEFPAGYSLAGWLSSRASASPTGNDSQHSANGNNSLNSVSQLKGALHKRRPFPCNPIPAANCNRGHLNRRRFGAMLLPGGMGLAVLDVENVVRHYSYTGLGWLRRFQEKRSTLDPARYDRIFQRMWEYYPSCGSPGFGCRGLPSALSQ